MHNDSKRIDSHTCQLLPNKCPPNFNEQGISCIKKVGAAPPRVTPNSEPKCPKQNKKDHLVNCCKVSCLDASSRKSFYCNHDRPALQQIWIFLNNFPQKLHKL